MEKIVRMHLNAGEMLLAGFGQGDEPGVRHLGFSPDHSLHKAQQIMAGAIAGIQPDVLVFHNGFGINWNLAGDHKNCLYLHTDYKQLCSWLEPLLPYTDGCLCVNKRLKDKILDMGDNTGMPSLFTIPSPVDFSLREVRQNKVNAPLVIGYSGRVEVEQKRLDRLASFLGELDRGGQSYRMEILGDGSCLESLKHQFADREDIVFHGHQTGEAYRSIIREWKYIVFLSDFEGLPLSLIEAVAEGVCPVYPDFHKGEDWVTGLHGNCLYPVGNTRKAAERLMEIESTWDRRDWDAFSQSAMDKVRLHSKEAYWKAFHGAIGEIKVIRAGPRSRFRQKLLKMLPLWLFNRLDRIRRS